MRIAAHFELMGMTRLRLLTLRHAIEAHPHHPLPLVSLADHYFSADDESKGLDLLGIHRDRAGSGGCN